jgi:glucose-1-phosphate thymidylyltransferase
VKKGKGSPDVIGLIPAAGYSRRISPLPCSKEIYPVGFFRNSSGDDRPKAVCLYLIESMRQAGITKIVIVIRKGKFDIPAYLGDGRHFGVDLVYRVMEDSPSPSHALDHAYPFVKNTTVAFGFPDIIFHAPGAFARLLSGYWENRADVALGVFRIKKASNDDRVVLDRKGWVKKFEVSASGARDPHTWTIAVWGPRFTQFVHDFLQGESDCGKFELTMGHILEPAFRNGLRLWGILFSKGSYLDIGTPESLAQAVRRYSKNEIE